jgi:hypothetical protein
MLIEKGVKMKIKVLERFSTEGQVYEAEEIRVVSDDVGRMACGAGWAEDQEADEAKRVPTEPRSTVPKTLNVKKMNHDHAAMKSTSAPKGV